MTYDELIKEADFLESGIKGMLGTIKDQVDFKKPFETLFGVLGTSVAWSFGWIVGVFVTIAQMYGYGPGQIGKLIDQYFFSQGASSVKDMDLSKSNVESASNYVASVIGDKIPDDLDINKVWNNIKNKITGVFASNIQELKEIKGNINSNDKIAIKYATLSSFGFTKTARISHIKEFLKQWRKGKKLPLITGILMKIVWSFAKGLAILGIAGGAATMMGMKPGKTPEAIREMEKKTTRPGLKHYSNVDKNIKRTLLTFLNARIANFSRGFIEAQKRSNPKVSPISVENAPGWSKVMKLIEEYNWGPLSEINHFSAFVGPQVDDVARILLNSVNTSGVKIEKLEDRLRQLLEEE